MYFIYSISLLPLPSNTISTAIFAGNSVMNDAHTPMNAVILRGSVCITTKTKLAALIQTKAKRTLIGFLCIYPFNFGSPGYAQDIALLPGST